MVTFTESMFSIWKLRASNNKAFLRQCITPRIALSQQFADLRAWMVLPALLKVSETDTGKPWIVCCNSR